MGSQELKVNPEQPLDSVVGNLIETIGRKGRGFVLDLANDDAANKSGLKITVEEKLPPRDTWMPRADYRAHVIEDTDSFIAYAKKYGTPEKSAVYVSSDGATLVLEEEQEEGTREAIKLDLPPSEDFEEWGETFGGAMQHKPLLTFLMEHEDNLTEPQILAAMQSVKVNSQVAYESDIADDGRTLGMVFKSNAGEEMKRFPKMFGIFVPVLKADEGDPNLWTRATVRLTCEMPDSPTGKPTWTMFCAEWETIHRRRIAVEANTIRAELEGWLVVEGRYATRPHELGKR